MEFNKKKLTMGNRELTKLQVRAEVLAVIQQLSTLEDTSRESQLKQIKRLKSISNVDYILECLLRELPRASYDHRQLISQMLLEFGTLDKLEKPLWGLIKDPGVTDELKDTANVILRNLGDPSDPDLYLSYLENPQALIEKETERMLKMTSINPEAQIDFLDFFFSLPPIEQVNLINSLKDDYQGEYLSCIFIPALEAKPQEDVYNLLVEALGNTRSKLALDYLENIYTFTNNEQRKKIIKKSINLLKLSGIKLIDEKCSTAKMLKNSTVYKCFASPVDGIGNQGIIISRLQENKDITLFSIVINDMQGIMDCFGFSQITHTDFDRIIQKFQEGTTRVNISAEYCKYQLAISERLNRILNMPIPYEYSAWKVLAADIGDFTEDLDALVTDLKDDSLIKEIHKLYNIPDFYCWFIEDDDHPSILSFFEENLSYFIAHLDTDVNSLDKICNYYNGRITEIIEEIFDHNWRELYYQRLASEAYLLKTQNMLNESKLAATAAWTLCSDSLISVCNNAFVFKLMQRSIAESLLRFQYKIDDNIGYGKSIISQDKIDKYKKLLDKIYSHWELIF